MVDDYLRLYQRILSENAAVRLGDAPQHGASPTAGVRG
jgi:hypothetical protein